MHHAPIEVADFLRLIGENPTSVDSYIEKVGIEKADGESNSPYLMLCKPQTHIYI